MAYILIGLAGALGAIARYILGVYVYSSAIFPIGTLVVNLIGCFGLGLLAPIFRHKSRLNPLHAQVVTSGFIGSFTTFSAFSTETGQLLQNGHILLGVIYIVLSLFGGLFICQLGYRLGKGVVSPHVG